MMTSSSLLLKPQCWGAPELNTSSSGGGLSAGRTRQVQGRVFARQRPSVEKLYNVHVEKNITAERAEELGVSRWRRWETGKCGYHWQWQVDEQVYIVKGCVQVTPDGCPDSAYFYAGDLVRFQKWFSADLAFEGEYEQHYRFLAYGDD